ncbi:hypothetical protein RRG08_015724 [Elysia crispata]|uniref:Uncharacterized protein n=1 Tax=Elysia crispata TaxID=231223 RepID=A0AAE0Z4X7_9GAST|nr:hypothetical protein RRG08_015724 [Elysia crispata]
MPPLLRATHNTIIVAVTVLESITCINPVHRRWQYGDLLSLKSQEMARVKERKCPGQKLICCYGDEFQLSTLLNEPDEPPVSEMIGSDG